MDTLFQHGKAFFVFPFRVIYLLHNNNANAETLQFGISVPKRNFKKAVHRNRIKRICREAYRLSKPSFKTTVITKKVVVHMMFMYTHVEQLSYQEVLTPMQECMKRMHTIVNELGRDII